MIIAFLLLLNLPLLATAATGGKICQTGQLCNPIGSEDLTTFVDKITATALKIGIPIAGLFIIWAGFKFVTARGDETAIKDAKKIFWYTIIGTAVLLAASLIATVLGDTVRQLGS